MSGRTRVESKRGNTLSSRVFEIQQECARLDFATRGEDRTAKWVAEQLAAALAEFEGVFVPPPADPTEPTSELDHEAQPVEQGQRVLSLRLSNAIAISRAHIGTAGMRLHDAEQTFNEVRVAAQQTIEELTRERDEALEFRSLVPIVNKLEDRAFTAESLITQKWCEEEAEHWEALEHDEDAAIRARVLRSCAAKLKENT